MVKWYRSVLPKFAFAGALLFMGVAAECPMDGDMMDNMNDNMGMDNMNDNGNPDPGMSLTPVDTGIEVHNSARVAAGDGIIAYGVGGFSGVDWIMKGDVAGRGIPDSNNYRASSFVVLGKKIVLVSSNDFTLTVFNTVDSSLDPIDVADIRLQNIPAGVQSAGQIRGDGTYVATMNDDSEVTDGKVLKIIDIAGDTPSIIVFEQNPPSQPDQLEVDAANKALAVAIDDMFYVYDIDNPAADPDVFDVSGDGGIEDTQIAFKGGYIFFHAFEDGSTRAKVLNTADGSVMDMGVSEAALNLCMNATLKYIYFVDRDANDSVGSDYRSGIGTIPNLSPTLADDTQVSSGTNNLGRFGWAQACAIPPNGNYYFLSTVGSIGTAGWFQVSTGGAFTLLPDPADASDNLRASDIHASDDIVAFKTGRNADTTLGYIDLP